MFESEDKSIVQECYSSARAHQDWPGKWTIRTYANMRGFMIRGEGGNEGEAWANARERIQAAIDRITDDDLLAMATTCSSPEMRLSAEIMLRERHPSEIKIGSGQKETPR